MFWICSVEKRGWVKSVVSWGILLWPMTFHTIQSPPIEKGKGEGNPDPAWIGMVKPDLCSSLLKFASCFLVGPPWNPRNGCCEISKPQIREPCSLSPRLVLLLCLAGRYGEALAMIGVVCSSWSVVNLHTSQRSILTPYGDMSRTGVRIGNKMVARPGWLIKKLAGLVLSQRLGPPHQIYVCNCVYLYLWTYIYIYIWLYYALFFSENIYI